MEREWFIFYQSFLKAGKNLPNENRLSFYDRVLMYWIEWIDNDSWDAICESMFQLVKPQIDANNKRFENGSKGWRPKQSETKEEPNNNLNETISKPKENVKEKEKENIKDNEKEKYLIISSKEDTTQALVVSENKSKPEINSLIESIKQTLEPIGLIYKAGKQERQRAQNILTAKEFGETCEKAGMSREKFVIEIVKLSAKLDFWNWKIYNCETFYEHYPKVYNEARRMKKEKEAKKIHSY